MFIDLIDHLRCLEDHGESWLVAAVERMEGRYVARGSLGCPVCHTTYDVRDFVAYFTLRRPTLRQQQRPSGEGVVRLAALLDLRTAGGFVGLAAEWASYAAPLALTYDVQCVVLDDAGLAAPGDGVSVLAVADRIPLAPASLRAIALDADSTLNASMIRAVRAGGRVMGPATLAVPVGVSELARDNAEWVGERLADVSSLVGLVRGR